MLARAHARTHAHGRPTTNDATCGPPAWLAGSLHEGGIRSVRSPLRRAPLPAALNATPLQGGRPERSSLLVSRFTRLRFNGMAPSKLKLLHQEPVVKKVSLQVHASDFLNAIGNQGRVVPRAFLTAARAGRRFSLRLLNQRGKNENFDHFLFSSQTCQGVGEIWCPRPGPPGPDRRAVRGIWKI